MFMFPIFLMNTHSKFGPETNSILAAIKQTCFWKMDLILTFGFFPPLSAAENWPEKV